MDKIYSRKRIKIPKIIYGYSSDNPKYKIKRNFLKLFLIILIAITVLGIIVNSINPIIDALCIEKTKSIATVVSNEKATEVMEKYQYEDIITIYRDKNNNVTMLKSNIIPINKIVSDVATYIQKGLNSTSSDELDITLGSITGSRLLSGMGPKIPIKVSTIGSIETNFKSEFKAVGINQTLHRIYLEVKCNVNILIPFHAVEEQIVNQVIIAENVIVGIVPSTYYNLEGMKDENAVDILE